jgi:hypothetical protein
MGDVTVKVKLGNPVSKSREKIVDRALVDTGGDVHGCSP